MSDETLYPGDWSEWVSCPECGSDNVVIVHRETIGASSGYLWCEDCGRFKGQGPGIEGNYIGEDPADLDYGFVAGGPVGETHYSAEGDR